MIAFFIALTAAASPLPTPQSSDDTVLLGEAAFELALPMPTAASDALAARDHGAAGGELGRLDRGPLTKQQQHDLGFLRAWVAIRGKKADSALIHLADVEASRTAPDSYRWLTIGEIHLANRDLHQAADAFRKIPADQPIAARAKLQLAAAHQQSGATREALTLYADLANREDPAESGEIALWALAQKKGLSNPAARPLLLRLWMHYPLSAAAKSANTALMAHHKKPSADEYGTRAIRLMELGAWSSVNGTVAPRVQQFPLTTEMGCAVQYAHGRSLFKRNQVTAASAVLTRVGTQCVRLNPEVGPKALYIAGKSFDRKKEWASAAATYQQIPELYPTHSMADDGYALGGIAWVEAEQPAQAIELWTRQADAYPTGDMAGEGFWRLAWMAYLSGDPETAIDVAERMVREVPIHVDPVHVMGARYWSSRWRIYPDVEHPDVQSPDTESVNAGIAGLISLVNDHPAGFYSLLAAARLAELDPTSLSAASTPPIAEAGNTWTVRKDFFTHPATQRGLALARLGLTQEAMAEFAELGSKLTPSEVAIVTHIQSKAHPYRAHDRLHRALLHHPPSTLGPDRDRIMLAALPNHYFDTITEVTEDYEFDPRVFHALVREESSFNTDIRSWAGARGLSQVMPATGKRVAGWLGLSFSTKKLHDPQTNLAIGSRYLHYLFDHFDNNPFLAVAGYNAGEGNVGKWVKRFGNRPSDEFIEHIPFRETRHYVKRVLGTYQAYRVIRGPDPSLPKWVHTNHRVVSP